ncbi:acyl-CoA dehydrogenase family protein [Lampropedia puyangensis]|uniref:acyl-CoA dehydrogenase family protein n=1 Tax=Lampropedia puyangensis TaxID=1330072 RepID=UPI001FCE42DF|nr:acyl-CoA dehydrogenase family protein [Lampropedia puyangensis]
MPINEINGNAGAPTLAELQTRFAPVFARIADGAAERENHRTLAYEPIEWLRDAGFTALRVPLQWGGSGARLEDLFELWMALAQADSNVAQILRPHFGFIDRLLIDRDAQTQEPWLRLAGQGAIFGNATTEVGQGAVGELQTSLVPDAQSSGQWILNGRKFYSTGSLYADWISVVASAHQAGEAAAIVHAIVAADAPGVQLLDDWNGFGQRLTASGSAIFEQVRVADAAVLRFERQQPSALVAYFQLVHLATLAGIARAVQHDAVAYVQARKRVFSHGNATLPKDDPLVQQIIGQLAATAYMAQVVVRDVAASVAEVARLRAHAIEVTKAQLDALESRTAQAQVAVVDSVLQAATKLFDVGGSSALAESMRLDRHWRNARTLASHNPVIYKAQAVGDTLLNGAEPVYYWNVGIKAA